MKLEIVETQHNIALSASLSATALISGSYGLYNLLQKNPSRMDWSTKSLNIFDKPVPLHNLIVNSAPASIINAGICTSIWKLVTGAFPANSAKGIATLTAAYTFPTALAIYANLDSRRSYDEAITLFKAIATSISAATAASLIVSGKAQSSKVGVVALAATTTFPAALTFFNCKTKDDTELDRSIIAKAVSTTVAVVGAVSLVACLRLTN